MIHLSVFFTTQVFEKNPTNNQTSANGLTRAGDLGLWTLRYLWNGRTVTVERINNQVVDVASKAPPRSFLRTLAAIALLITMVPWLLGGILKAVSYAFSTTRELHAAAKRHLTPLPQKHIRFATVQSLNTQLSLLRQQKNHNSPLPELIIQPYREPFGQASFNLDVFSQGLGLAKLNPHRLILFGKASSLAPLMHALNQEQALLTSGNWETEEPNKILIGDMEDLEDARNFPQPVKRDGSGEVYNVVIQVQKGSDEEYDPATYDA